MVHAVKLTWKLGFGLLNDRQAARLAALVEAGYLIGSLLFTVGTVHFFPLEGLEDYVLGCRYYEAGSVVFAFLTLYTEIDRYQARRRGDEERVVTKRELLEECLYCAGSFIFLFGTFLFDPPVVENLSEVFSVSRGHIEDTAAAMFMIGSFLFSFGSYVNALTIFEAPRMFRRLLLYVTTSYMFGGLFFIAGTMGYVHAFEPNLALRWCSTWFYLVGCFFYVIGSFLAFVSTVAKQQVHWERVRLQEQKKENSMASLVGRASAVLPKSLMAVARKQGKARSFEPFEDEPDGPREAGAAQAEDTARGAGVAGASEDAARAIPETGALEEIDLDAVLGPAGQELEGPMHGEEKVFAAFWRFVTGAGQATAEPPQQDARRSRPSSEDLEAAASPSWGRAAAGRDPSPASPSRGRAAAGDPPAPGPSGSGGQASGAMAEAG
mmetsp:Transcript_70149/g.221522  ORF Transcript_70149/g.221522 Transcript_70149/m.221522 type:complete len:437 (-) Transcript_70149:277-1587(-)